MLLNTLGMQFDVFACVWRINTSLYLSQVDSFITFRNICILKLLTNIGCDVHRKVSEALCLTLTSSWEIFGFVIQSTAYATISLLL